MYDFFSPYREIIPDFDTFIESLSRPAPVHLRVNHIKVTPERLVHILTERGIYLKPMGDDGNRFFEAPGLKSPGNLPEYFSGYIHPQAFTSCLASMVLAPHKESLVLDMCSSPGGKTAHMADIMGNSGLIIANELYPTRHIPLGHTLTRLGIINTVYTEYQAQEFPLKQRFDFIMADVPCSGEGRIRKPDDSSNSYPSKPHPGSKLLELQKKMILRGFDLLKDSGVMLYSTCTYNPSENEETVQFLLENRDAELLPIDIPFPHMNGLTEYNGVSYDRQLNRTARFYPHIINSVGFFMARIGKRR
jgi:tRNA (cytosine49-C5)-methyltransferase